MMYVDGIFKSSELSYVSEEQLPSDAIFLNQYEQVKEFFASSKDLAICCLKFPDAFDSTINKWSEEYRGDFYFPSIKVDEFETCLDPLSFELVKPFRRLLLAIEENLAIYRHNLTLKKIYDQMCPLFHVDNLKLRVICALQGSGTQWLSDEDAHRKNLGKAGRKPIAKDGAMLQQLQTLQVGILKGSRFRGAKGLIHRSPYVNPSESQPRIFVRFDYP